MFKVGNCKLMVIVSTGKNFFLHSRMYLSPRGLVQGHSNPAGVKYLLHYLGRFPQLQHDGREGMPDTYSHVSLDLERKAAARLNEVLKKEKAPSQVERS